jgi:MYXO-CTERM domain-containing protein
MTRNSLAPGLLGGALALTAALALSTRPAGACSLNAGGLSGAALSPIDGNRVGVGGAFLLTRERAPWLEAPTGEPSVLTLVRRFDRLQNSLAPGLALFEPSVPLLPEQQYALHVSDSTTVHFFAQAETPRKSAELRLNVALEEIPENRLNSAGCYGGPLNDRPFTQMATFTLAYAQPAPLVLSVIGHDQASGQDVEDSTFDGDLLAEPADGLSLSFPLPEGVSRCFHVAVVDFAGTALFDTPELCADAEGSSQTFSADVVDLGQPGPSPDEPAPSNELQDQQSAPTIDAQPTAASCALTMPSQSPSPLLGAAMAVLGLLVVRRRPRAA